MTLITQYTFWQFYWGNLISDMGHIWIGLIILFSSNYYCQEGEDCFHATTHHCFTLFYALRIKRLCVLVCFHRLNVRRKVPPDQKSKSLTPSRDTSISNWTQLIPASLSLTEGLSLCRREKPSSTMVLPHHRYSINFNSMRALLWLRLKVGAGLLRRSGLSRLTVTICIHHYHLACIPFYHISSHEV